MKRVLLRLTPRARRDIEERTGFVARFPGGKPEERVVRFTQRFNGSGSFRSSTPLKFDDLDRGWHCDDTTSTSL